MCWDAAIVTKLQQNSERFLARFHFQVRVLDAQNGLGYYRLWFWFVMAVDGMTRPAFSVGKGGRAGDEQPRAA
jgi:hypothetical protein